MKSKRSIDEATERRTGGLCLSRRRSAARQSGRAVAHAASAGCEVHRATAPFTVSLQSEEEADSRSEPTASPARVSIAAATVDRSAAENHGRLGTFPAGSYIVRMDQPYSRIADALLDHQYWAPNDPQTEVYDDTGWTMGELGNVQVVRVTDVKVLERADGSRQRRSARAGGSQRHWLDLSGQS